MSPFIFQFEITGQTRDSTTEWRDAANLWSGDYLFASRMSHSPQVSSRRGVAVWPIAVLGVGAQPVVGEVRSSAEIGAAGRAGRRVYPGRSLRNGTEAATV